VAETFPNALSPLEEDLWVEPLRSGIRSALEIAGALPKRALRRSPIIVSVGGRVAGDLDLLGMRERPTSFLARLDPRPPARRLAVAWRVGRLRRAMPLLAGDVLTEVDRRLREVPPLADLTDDQLLTLLSTTSASLHGVHGYEVLAGIVGEDHGSATGAAAALAAIARGRAAGQSDAGIVALDPVVLALSAPAIGARSALPDVAITGPDIEELGEREALRLRARWLHELAARAAFELGQRLHERGALVGAELVRYLTRDELTAVVAGGRVPEAVAGRAAVTEAAPLPASFRLTEQGAPVPIVGRRGRRLDGRGAGGGRGIGIVHNPTTGPPPAGSVLVVRALEPGLAALLPGLSGIVAETGSVLSHLAILAREVGVPTVVAVENAVDRFPPGARILVDGNTGEVTVQESDVA
jgi:rifampicin phosphotransferase